MKNNLAKIASYFGSISASLVIAGCGGNVDGTIGGTVNGLSGGASITLQNNANETLTVSTNGNFAFVHTISGGNSYNVTILTQPLGETCTVANGSGTVRLNSGNVTNVTISCVANITIGGTVGGTVAGLASGKSVTLENNAGNDLSVSANGAFVFSQPVANGAAYAVTVLTQPAGQTCTVANGSGSITGTGVNVSNVTVTCN